MQKGKLLRTIRREEISTRCVIGRGEDCELRLSSRSVSRHHALLLCNGVVHGATCQRRVADASRGKREHEGHKAHGEDGSATNDRHRLRDCS